MSEETKTEPAVDPADSAPPPPVKKSGRYDWREVRGRFKDLVVVFFGVYAAFLLNRFEGDRRDSQRRAQLLDALEHEVSANAADLKGDLAQAKTQLDEFDRALAAGEMPNLGIVYSNSAYSPSDDATVLQAGGLELLDVRTLDALRKVNTLQRSLVAATRSSFELELTILGTHESAEFYDPETRKLKKHYLWYPFIQHRLLGDAQALLSGEEEFLALIRTMKNGRVGGL